MRDAELHWREIDGEIVALELRSERYLHANAAAAALWPLLVAGTSLQELAAALVERFGVDPNAAAADAASFVAWLREERLVVDAT